MQAITLDNILPKVFLQYTDIQSDVWRQQLRLERGKTYLVEASSGMGKSSLCSYIIGYRNDYTGTIRFDGRDIRTNHISDWVSLRQQSLSTLFQELRLFPELTAMENIEIKNSLTSHLEKAEVVVMFERLGIADKMDSPVRLMSFGQQQRVAMIRALAQPFDFLLADEPVSHLDEYNSQVMADIMMEEAHRQGAAVIVTSIGKHMQIPYDKTIRL